MIDRLRSQLKRHEAYRTRPYDDDDGEELTPGKTLVGKLTIGVGWNLTDNGLPDDIIEQLLDLSMDIARNDCVSIFSNWHSLPENIQLVLWNMSFNLGGPKLRRFKKMIAAVEDRNWDRMAAEMVNSRWYVQVATRGQELVEIVRGVK